MAAKDAVSVWIWAAFVVVILIFLALDLGVFHRPDRPIKSREAILWSVVWFAVAMLFACGLAAKRGPGDALEFVTSYFVEYSLSLDNVVAIALIFSYFNVPAAFQHRVLFFGILGALISRGLMIGVGAALIQSFHWILYIMGAFLVFTGAKWAFSKQAPGHPGNNKIVQAARKLFPISDAFDKNKFLTFKEGRRMLTPLALVLLVVETTDLIFAVDSIPAIFAVTQKAFIIFTSNILAVMGLRSLYFAVAGALKHFRYLKAGLAVVLMFVGLKMLAAHWLAVPTGLSLAIVAGIVGCSILLSRGALKKT
jgi:tellurite resistance protein TerC